jgi:hypothetical protein
MQKFVIEKTFKLMFFNFCSAEDLKFCWGGLFYINYEAIPVNEQTGYVNHQRTGFVSSMSRKTSKKTTNKKRNLNKTRNNSARQN